ncbi:sigma factor regulatory protein, FecR family [Arcobacter venerupis]|uniref:Sigma factor regulatory protein, FecR family n=1 Tax=Arcobacter venerupis TaxID=1054033 RepID=A0AAE7BAS9_9BACT|nr:FecR domain-containing protein [Arcobacter venerupis]QKF67716.1 sigma factor regulatory protein, FecR family [Arcobacter venerupis]RWS49129.1 siderophore-interacting protein [Arcobacter venerupis]
MNIKTKIKEEAIYWLACEKEGLNELEKQELKHWLESNQEHQKAYNRMKLVHQMAKSISKENAQILSEQAHKEARKIRFLEKTRYFSSASAILLIVCFSAFKIYDNNFAVQYSKTFQTDKTNLANQQLPDGSNIFIDAKTNLNIEFYKGKREVTLNNGRVMFEVAKDENRVFIIKSGDINIEVVGTKFEVIHKKDITTINVEEGIVKTYFSSYFFDKQNEKLLTKENSITYSNFQGNINNQEKINPEKIALWRENLISLNKVSLKDAFDEFSKYNDISTSFSSKEVENYLITAEFSSTQLEIFLKTISKIYPLKVDKNDKNIRISKKN